MITGYISGREILAAVFVLIDSRHTPQAIDLEFVEWLAGEDIPYALVFSKADKVKPGALKTHVAQFLEKIAPFTASPPPVFITSAETREGRRELLAYITATLAGGAAA